MFDLSDWEAGWWLWIVIDVAAVIVLAAAIVYGSQMWRRRSRNPAVKRESDEATKRMYHPDEDLSRRPHR